MHAWALVKGRGPTFIPSAHATMMLRSANAGHRTCARPFRQVAVRPAKLQRCSVAQVATPPAAATSPFLADLQFHNPSWADVANEEQFMALLQKQVDAGRCPKQLVPLWADFFNNYKLAMLASAASGDKEELAARVQATIADTVLMEARIGLGRGRLRVCGWGRLAVWTRSRLRSAQCSPHAPQPHAQLAGQAWRPLGARAGCGLVTSGMHRPAWRS